MRVMNFIKTDNVKDTIISTSFLNNVDCIIRTKTVIHHLHINGEIIGYTHSFDNLKVRENKNQISLAAQNMFGFDFFFFLKDLRLGFFHRRQETYQHKFCKHR